MFSRFFFFFFCFSPDSSSFPGTLSFKNHYFHIYRYLWEVEVNLFELLFDVHPGPRPVPTLQLEPPPDRRCVHFVQWRPCRVPLCRFEQGAGAGTKAGPEALYGRLENMSGHRTTSCCCCSCGCKCLNIFFVGHLSYLAHKVVRPLRVEDKVKPFRKLSKQAALLRPRAVGHPF